MKITINKLSFQKMFWIFLIASIFGALYEEILYIVKSFINLGIFDWEPRRGVFWGPISPVYGVGAVVMCLVLTNKNDTLSQTFIKASILGGAVEYIISFLQETFLKTTSWDYSGYFLDINGRTTIPFMLFWGVLGVCFVKFIYPFLSGMVDGMQATINGKFTTFLVVLLSFDMTISWTALIRQTLRHNNISTIPIVDKFYDDHFDDDYIMKKFPNMVRSE